MNTKRELVLKTTLAIVLPVVLAAGIGAAQARPPRSASVTVPQPSP